MGRTTWVIVASLALFLAAQVSGVFTAEGSGHGAKALFYTETGTSVAPKAEDQMPVVPDAPQPPIVPKPTASSKRTVSRNKPEMSQGPWLGIAYWVEWQRPGAVPTRIADPSRFVFRSGDRIRLHVKTNVPGYLYVVNRGASGRDTMLFPYVGMPDRLNRVEGHKDYAVPPRGWIMFDNQPGEEVLFLAVSPYALTSVLDSSFPGSALAPSASARLFDAVDRRGAKDLLIETDDSPGQQATYVGAMLRPIATEPQGSTLVTYTIRLQHQ